MSAKTAGSVRAQTAFFRRAPQHTALLGVSTPSGVFVVEAAGAERSLPSLRQKMNALASAMATLDALGMGSVCRGRYFVELGAVVGTASVAAVAQHGFARALAVEAAASTIRINLILNDVEDLVEAVPDASLDAALTDRGVDPDDVGLLWIPARADALALLAAAASVLRRRCPLVLGGQAGLKERLQDEYASVVDLSRPPGRHKDVHKRVCPIADMSDGVSELLVF